MEREKEEPIPRDKWLKIRQEAFRLFRERGNDERNWEKAFEKVLGEEGEQKF